MITSISSSIIPNSSIKFFTLRTSRLILRSYGLAVPHIITIRKGKKQNKSNRNEINDWEISKGSSDSSDGNWKSKKDFNGIIKGDKERYPKNKSSFGNKRFHKETLPRNQAFEDENNKDEEMGKRGDGAIIRKHKKQQPIRIFEYIDQSKNTSGKSRKPPFSIVSKVIVPNSKIRPLPLPKSTRHEKLNTVEEVSQKRKNQIMKMSKSNVLQESNDDGKMVNPRRITLRANYKKFWEENILKPNFHMLEHDFLSWCRGTRLSKFYDCFKGMDWKDIIQLNEEQLKELGVGRPSSRRIFLRGFKYAKVALEKEMSKVSSDKYIEKYGIKQVILNNEDTIKQTGEQMLEGELLEKLKRQKQERYEEHEAKFEKLS
ncbi:2274_t:CDS:2 [Acaulospora morrowiae]|uniref:2274_t:CDS:1 n=1 Tax=Acaulospora morrowiae TaxID=94023 RepID=A0A9N8ZPR0_9GLOM|nr:2274_t:CDS:2 [Acaulospora morrowiae]